MLYHTVGSYLPLLGDIISTFTLGIGKIASTPIEIDLYNWIRKSELTADRAGLLCCQNYNAAITTFMKIAGAPYKYYNRLNPEDFLKQADEFEDIDESKIDKFIKIFSGLYSTHPWAVIRAKELDKWLKMGGYEEILKTCINDTKYYNKLKEDSPKFARRANRIN